MSLLDSLLGRRPRVAAPLAATPRNDGLPSNPSVDPGIRTQSSDQMLEAHRDLIVRIKLAYGSDRETFERDILGSIRKLADYVNLLPATSDNFFSEVGGLFRMALEVGFYALLATDSRIVAGRESISLRTHLEPRWRLATFLAGLCSEVHRTLSNVVVTDAKGVEWQAYLGPLTPWLDRRTSDRFFVRWLANAQESRALGLFALPHIVPPATMQYLADRNSVAVPQMLACLSGVPLYRNENILADLVSRSAASVIDRDLLASANRYGRAILGAHLERYLIDAMRRLVASNPAWSPNTEKTRVWYGLDGMYLVWPNAAAEIRKLLEEDQLPGIPKAPETIMEILLSAGVFVAFSVDRPLWQIKPPKSTAAIEAIKLSSPMILLPPYAEVAPPLDHPLATSSDSTTAALSGLATHSEDPRVQSSAVPSSFPGKRRSAPSEPVQHTVNTGQTQTQSPPAIQQCDSDGVILNFPNPLQRSEVFSPAPDSQAHPVRDLFSEATADDLHMQAPLDIERSPPDPRAADFALLPLPKLHPQVRDVLSRVVDSLNGDAATSLAVTVPSGVFVPIDPFRAARIDTPVLLRALADSAMCPLTASGRVTTVEHDIAGKSVVGFVLLPKFVRGLDPADFTTKPALGGTTS